MSQQKTYQSVPCQDWLMCKKKGVLCWTILRIKQSSCDRFTIIALKGQQTISRNWCWRSRYHQATVESTQNWYNLVLSSVLFNSSFFFLVFFFSYRVALFSHLLFAAVELAKECAKKKWWKYWWELGLNWCKLRRNISSLTQYGICYFGFSLGSINFQ